MMEYYKINVDYVQEDEKNVDYVKYFERRLNFKFDEYVDFIDGEVLVEELKYYIIRYCAMFVKVNKVFEKEFLDSLGSNCIKEPRPLPNVARLCSVGEKFEKMDLKATYTVFEAAKHAKTNTLCICVACDGDDMYALFEG
ncbi:MAG: hypothetical protein E7266_10965 [Lachnospiraceae bacterium]|nr:hypothetical protein [Lachnospiraceae bacterium]